MSRILHIRLCNDVLWCSVTDQQWQRFLRSQLRTTATDKINLDNGTSNTSMECRGYSTDGILEERREEGRREQRHAAG